MNIKSEAFNMWNTYFMNSFIPFLDQHASVRNMDFYGDYNWSTRSPLDYDIAKIFGMIQFDNRLENHMWCLNSFNESIEKLIDIAEQVEAEIAIY